MGGPRQRRGLGKNRSAEAPAGERTNSEGGKRQGRGPDGAGGGRNDHRQGDASRRARTRHENTSPGCGHLRPASTLPLDIVGDTIDNALGVQANKCLVTLSDYRRPETREPTKTREHKQQQICGPPDRNHRDLKERQIALFNRGCHPMLSKG